MKRLFSYSLVVLLGLALFVIPISSSWSADTLKVTTPNGGEIWVRGKSYAIKWNKGTRGSRVQIRLLKSGKHYMWVSGNPPYTSATPNDGKFTWKIPSSVAVGSDYKIRIINHCCHNPDYSDRSFTITNKSGSGSSLSVTTPNGGQSWTAGKKYTIKWVKGNAGGTVKIQLLKSGKHYKWVSKKTKNDGNYIWKIPTTVVTGSAYKVKIVSVKNKKVFDKSNKNFTISKTGGGDSDDDDSGSLKVSTPNGGETWKPGKKFLIKWDKVSAGTHVKIQLLKSGKHSLWVSEKTKNDGKYTWKIPSAIATGSAYKIKITSRSDTSVSDLSDSNFTITKGRVDNISGSWSGWWTSSMGESGAITATFGQEGGAIYGPVTIYNSVCFGYEYVTGTIKQSESPFSGSDVEFGVSSNAIIFKGDVSQYFSGIEIRGSYYVYNRPGEYCTGDTGDYGTFYLVPN